jgi:hypothetical protein
MSIAATAVRRGIRSSYTVYVIGGANRPSHEGGISTVEPWTFS